MKVTEKNQKEMFLEKLKREYIYLFFYVLKNELRGPGKDCVKRIQTYVKESKESKKLDEITVEVSSKANKLLYLIWKKPSRLRIAAVRFIISVFDRV